jgi:plasmid stabilization system protein ParE
MNAEVIFAPEAEQDIAEAYNWYEGRRVGLGEEFLSCVDASIQKIRRDPNLYPVIYKEYRRTLVRRFPYVVFYEFFDTTVWIYSVFHTSLDPGKWRARLS